jgi:hypothetical protein
MLRFIWAMLTRSLALKSTRTTAGKHHLIISISTTKGLGAAATGL